MSDNPRDNKPRDASTSDASDGEHGGAPQDRVTEGTGVTPQPTETGNLGPSPGGTSTSTGSAGPFGIPSLPRVRHLMRNSHSDIADATVSFVSIRRCSATVSRSAKTVAHST